MQRLDLLSRALGFRFSRKQKDRQTLIVEVRLLLVWCEAVRTSHFAMKAVTSPRARQKARTAKYSKSARTIILNYVLAHRKSLAY